jgi:hypothetical protein
MDERRVPRTCRIILTGKNLNNAPRRETRSKANFSTTNPTWTLQALNPGRGGDIPKTTSPNRGTGREYEGMNIFLC